MEIQQSGVRNSSESLPGGHQGIDHVDTSAFEVGDIASRNCQNKMSDCGNLTVGRTGGEAEFLALAHQLTVDARGRFIVGKYALVEGQGDESFSKP